MKFGAFLLAPQYPGQDHGTVLDGTVAAAVAADEAGFDEVWVAEHHFISYGVCPSAVTLAGYLLAATRRVAVGTAVSVLSTAHPIAVAEQAALLDQLSGGRFRLGVGRGGPWVDLDVFGTGLSHWEHGYPAALDVLLETLRTGCVAGTLPLVPAPRTRPHPPVVTAVTSQDGLQVAAARHLPMLLGMHADDKEKAAFTARYAALTGGLDPGHLAAGVAHVADTRAQALAELRAALPGWLGPGLAGYRRAGGAPYTPRDPHAYTELLCQLHPIGTPEDCVRILARSTRRTGVRQHLLLVETTGDAARTRDNIARLGAEVLPRLRAGTATEITC